MLPVLVLLAAVIASACIPLLFNTHFYFFDDTAEGAYGQWFELGEQLRNGSWPLLNPQAWAAGNYAAEGQWGLWNPLVMGIALVVSFASNAVAVSTAIKIFFLALGAWGVYLLAKSFHAKTNWAFVAGFASAFTGFTLFRDASAWVTNEMVWALSAWTFWSIRRFLLHRKSIFVAVICGYFLVTVGYVEGTIILVAFYLATIADMVWRRDWRKVRTTLLIGAIHGLFALTVYLPGVLTSSVTERASEIDNNGFMVVTLTGLGMSTSGFGNAPMGGWWGGFTDVPLLYIAWFLPLVALVGKKHLGLSINGLRSLLLFGGFVLLMVLGPSQIGAIRFPARSLPWLSMALLIALAVLLSHSRVTFPNKTRLAVMLTWTAVATYLAIASMPTTDVLKKAVAHTLLYAISLIGLWLWFRYRDSHPHTHESLSDRWLLTGGIVVISIAVIFLQSFSFAHLLQAHTKSPYPYTKAQYETALPGGEGDAIIVGDVLSLPDSFWSETSLANSWYVNDTDVQNLYTPVSFRTYQNDICLKYQGRTCAGLADKLFETDPTTGAQLADLLSIDTVQILISEDEDLNDLKTRQVPAGWHVAATGEQSITWVRDTQTPDAGEAVWASGGVSYHQVSNSNLTSTIHIDSVPANGGSVVFSRLDWPGYSATGATLADATRGYLLTVDIPADAAGTDVTITFRPPGWTIEVAAFALAWIIAIAAQALYFWHRRRSQSSNSSDPQGKDRP